MTVKELKSLLNELDEDLIICVGEEVDFYVELRKRHIKKVSRKNSKDKYVIDSHYWEHEGQNDIKFKNKNIG